MIIDGVLGSSAVDSSSEVLDIEGADLSDVSNGNGILLNWEHEPTASGPSTIVGKVVFAKKIYGLSDCNDARQRMYWEKIKVPLIYGVCRIFDEAGHAEAKNIAAIIRDSVANDEPIAVKFSVEGSTLLKEGNILKRSIIRMVAITVRPCNKTATSGLLQDNAAPEGFTKAPVKGVEEILSAADAKKHEHPLYTRLGHAAAVECNPMVTGQLAKAATDIETALVAGRLQLGILEALRKRSQSEDDHEVNRLETPSDLSKADGSWESEDGLTIPRQGTPARKRWDAKFVDLLTTHFGAGRRLRIPVADITHRNQPVNGARLAMYTQMAQAGDTLPPLIVQASPFGGYHAVDGNHRLAAARAAGMTHLDAIEPTVNGARQKVSAPRQKVLAKASEAGSTDAAPSTLTGGAALQREDLRTSKRKNLLQLAKEAVKAYDEAKHGDFRSYLGTSLPEASSDFLDHFAGLIDDVQVRKLAKGAPEDFNTAELDKDPEPTPPGPVYGHRGALLNRGKEFKIPDLAAKKKVAVEEGEEPTEEEAGPKGPLTFRGRLLTPNPRIKLGTALFNEGTGELHIPRGTFKMYNPDQDEEAPGSGKAFHDIWHSPAVRKQHDYAVRNWIRVNTALKDGRLPHSVLATSVAFAMCSPNTPVSSNELMYAYLMDTVKAKGVDLRDPKFGEGYEELYQKKKNFQHPVYQDWVKRDTPHGFPEHSKPYFENDIRDLITNKQDSVGTDRVAGERSSFMLAANKFRNMARYHQLHDYMVDLVSRHGTDTRAAVAEMMKSKAASVAWEAARKRQITVGKPDPGPFQGHVVPGLAPKTARFAYSMLGGGNSFVPDTHFCRHLFGLDKAKDSASTDFIKQNIMWKPNNSDLLGAMDRWYFRNHPAVQYLLDHDEFGSYFHTNPEQAIFPAFWGHWLAISPHEAALGHALAAQASNQSASHRPLFEEIERQTLDPKEAAQTIPARTTTIDESPFPQGIQQYPAPKVRKNEGGGEPLVHPVHAGVLLNDWYNRLEPAHASLRFYTHLIPLLMPESHDMTTDLNVHVRKSEFLGIELRKAADGVVRTPSAYHDAARNFFGLPSTVVDAEVHHDPEFPLSEDQKKLVSGMDVHSRAAVDRPAGAYHGLNMSWHKGPSGMAVVKHGDEAEREVRYHDAARNFFGLGDYVPTTAMVRPDGVRISVQQMVPEGQHHIMSRGSPEAAHHARVLRELADSGDLDKLAMMDAVLGNGDRHNANYMFSDHAKAPLQLIDHGSAFAATLASDVPRYLRGNENGPVSPVAQQWLRDLKPDVLERQLGAEYGPGAARRLRKLQGFTSRFPQVRRHDTYHQAMDLMNYDEAEHRYVGKDK